LSRAINLNCHLRIKTGLIFEDLKIKTGLKFPLPRGERVGVRVNENLQENSGSNVDTVVNSGFKSYPSFGG